MCRPTRNAHAARFGSTHSHARVPGPTPVDVGHTPAIDTTLVQAWSLRASRQVFPAKDAAVFTRGLLPEDGASICFFVRGACRAIDMVGTSATEVIASAATALPDVLDGRHLTKADFGVQLARRVGQQATSRQLSSWQLPWWHVSDRTLGESIVRTAPGVVALPGLLYFAPPRGRAATFVRTDRCGEAPSPRASREPARGDLVRHRPTSARSRPGHCAPSSRPDWHFLVSLN